MASLQEVFEAKAELQFGMPAGALARCRAQNEDPDDFIAYLCDDEKDSAILSAMWLAFRWGNASSFASDLRNKITLTGDGVAQ